MSKQAVAAGLLLAMMSAPGICGDTVQYGPAPDWVRPVAAPTDTKAATEAPSRSLYKGFQVRFTADTSEVFSEAFVRIQTPQGLQSLGNIVLPWKPDTDVLTVHRFRLLRGTEVIDVLGKGQTFEVLRRENNLEYSALDGVLTAALQPNGMEVGDVLDIAFTLKRDYRLIPAPEMVLVGFVEAPPADRIEVRAVWDKTMPLKWRATAEVIGARERHEGNTNELHWSATDIAALDQPTDAPLRFWREPLIEFSSYRSWNDLSQRLASLYAKATRLRAESPLKAEAATIAAASTDPVKRLEAALKLAQERVRYVFLGMADGGLDPANADETWQRRFGDCKGKSALLIAVLHELGIEAEPVAVNTRFGDAVQAHLPMINAFDHVIVRAHAGGKVFWLDGAGADSWRRDEMITPNYHWGLPLTSRGDGLVAMVAEPLATPQIETDTTVDASAGLYADAPFTATTRMHGSPAATLHAQLAQMTPSLRDQALRKYWKGEYDFVEPRSVREEFDAATGVLKLILDATAKLAWGGGRHTVDGMETGSHVDYARTTAVDADVPFQVAHPTYRVTRQRVTLPAKGTFTLSGKEYDASLAGYRYIRRAKLENGVMSAESSVQSLVTEIPAAQARLAEKTMNAMWKDDLEIVKEKYDPTDADISALRTRKYADRPNLNWRGNLFFDHGNYDDALKDFDAMIKLNADDAPALAMRGLTRFWLNDYPLARADLTAALGKEPRNAIALRALGAVERMSGQFPEAVGHLTSSLKIDPDNTFALGHRAYAYASMDQGDKALIDAADAIRVKSTYVEMYGLRAWIFAAEGHAEEALNELEAMIKECPPSPYLQWTLGQNYAHLRRYEDAVAAMNLFVEAHPDPDAYLSRASFRAPADIKGRLADVNAALALKPDNEAALNMRADLLGQSGDHDAAITVYSALMKKPADFAGKRRLHTLRGVEYVKAGRQAEGRKDLAAALADDPDGDAYNSYCWTLASARVDLPAALAACESALKVAPKDASYLDSRGFVLLQLGRLDEATASFDAALALEPRHGASLFGRGVARNRSCKCNDGEKDLVAGERLAPDIRSTYAKAGLTP